MNIIESIKYYEDDLERARVKLATYEFLNMVFSDIEFPKGVNTWATRLDAESYDGVHWVEFSPGHYEDSDKNMQPLIHAICQRFSVEFRKSKGYDNSSLEYSANFKYGVNEINVRVTGVVPKTCRIEETVENLSDEEIEQARQDALNNVQTTRTIRKIVCVDEE